MATAGPRNLAAQLEGAYRTLAGTDVEEFDVFLVAADALRELPEGGSWLWELTSRGNNPTGGRQDVAVVPRGSDTSAYPFSTNQWVGCGSISHQTFGLDSEWATLSLALALQEHTPVHLTALVSVLADGEQIHSATVRAGAPSERVELDVSGVDSLRVEATTLDTCGTAPKGYMALVQSYVLP